MNKKKQIKTVKSIDDDEHVSIRFNKEEMELYQLILRYGKMWKCKKGPAVKRLLERLVDGEEVEG